MPMMDQPSFSRLVKQPGGIDRIGPEPLDGIESRTSVVDRLEIAKLVLSLIAEVAAIHRDQNALGTGVFEQAIGDVDSSEGLAEPVAIWISA
jgi:hypothetical protein